MKNEKLTIEELVHRACVLFCETCNCGINRNICTSLGTCDEHDKFRTDIKDFLNNMHKS